MSTDRKSIGTIHVQEIGVAEINGGIRILTGSSEVAVSTAHAQYKFGQNTDKCSPIVSISFAELLNLQAVALWSVEARNDRCDEERCSTNCFVLDLK